MQNLLHDSFWYSHPFCYESTRRPTIFLQNISYTSNSSLLITNRLLSFWKRIVPTKHCSMMYSRLTINLWIISNVFVTLKLVFSKNELLPIVQLFFPLRFMTHKTDKLYNIANMYLIVNSSSWNLACLEQRVYWSFTEIALLVLCFRSIVPNLTAQTLYIDISQNFKNLGIGV